MKFTCEQRGRGSDTEARGGRMDEGLCGRENRGKNSPMHGAPRQAVFSPSLGLDDKMNVTYDEYGRPFIILREQAHKRRVKGLEAHKVRQGVTNTPFYRLSRRELLFIP